MWSKGVRGNEGGEEEVKERACVGQGVKGNVAGGVEVERRGWCEARRWTLENDGGEEGAKGRAYVKQRGGKQTALQAVFRETGMARKWLLSVKLWGSHIKVNC